MSRRTRRGRLGPPITLFSFQDIIASVTGVIIFVTFMLLIELMLRPADAAPAPASASVAAATARADDAERRLAELRARPAAAPVSEAELAPAREATAALADLARVLAERARELAPRVEEAQAQLAARRADIEAERQRLDEAKRELERERSRTRVTLLEGPRDGKETWFLECAEGAVRAGRIDAATGLTRLERAFATPDEALQWSLARSADRERFVLVVRPGGVEAYGRLQQALRAAGREIGWDLWAADTPLFSPAHDPDPDPEAADATR